MPSTDAARAAHDEFPMPPGTSYLVCEFGADQNSHIILVPTPSSDPNEPLNWSTQRKSWNFFLVMGVTLAIFTVLSVQSLFWQFYVDDLNASFDELNNSLSINAAGLSLGCMIFIPFAIKFGRRPVYLASTLVIFIMSIWTARMTTVWELYVTNFVMGLAGAANESLVMITVADLYFVHQRGTMNGIYMSMVLLGSYLTPIPTGVQADAMGWRWCYYMQSLFTGILFILFLFLYEETKYVPVIEAEDVPSSSQDDTLTKKDQSGKDSSFTVRNVVIAKETLTSNRLNQSIPMRTWKQRLTLYTPTSEPFLPLVYRPFIILFTFPTVMFAAVQYSFMLCWLVNTAITLSVHFSYPPYNFGAAQLGYMGIGPLIGSLLGSAYSGPISDRAVVWLARRNKGFYEPEMRLHLLHLPSICTGVGLAMFGATTAHGMHWILPAVGMGIFGFGLGGFCDTTLTFVIDSYRDITGESFIGISFVRNVFSIWMAQARGPWEAKMGVQDQYIVMACIALAVCLTSIPMAMYGKYFRAKLASRYYKLSERQF